jgi:hypothetical protein
MTDNVTDIAAQARQIGCRQIDCLRIFKEEQEFRPGHRGEPWTEMKTLISRALLVVEKRESHYWHEGQFRRRRRRWYARTSRIGLDVLAAIDRTEPGQ